MAIVQVTIQVGQNFRDDASVVSKGKACEGCGGRREPDKVDDRKIADTIGLGSCCIDTHHFDASIVATVLFGGTLHLNELVLSR